MSVLWPFGFCRRVEAEDSEFRDGDERGREDNKMVDYCFQKFWQDILETVGRYKVNGRFGGGMGYW